MDDELKRRIAAALDLPADAAADPEVVAALERDPAARAFAQGLYAIDEALAGWPLPERTAAEDERFAAAIEKRLGEAPWENTARVRDAIKPLSWDPTEPPPLLEDAPGRAADKPEHKPMAQSHDDKDNDDDLAGLAALARSSLSPGAPSVTTSIKPGPSLHDDAMDESSGIVDIQKLAAIALKQSTPPPAEQLRPARVDIDAAADSAVAAGEAPTRRESAREASVMPAAAVPASNAAAAERARSRADADAARAPVATLPARRGSPVVWMLPAAAAVAVGAWFGYGQLMHGDSAPAAQPAVATSEPSASELPPSSAGPTPPAMAPAVAPVVVPEGNAAPAPVAVAAPAEPTPAAAQPAAVAVTRHAAASPTEALSATGSVAQTGQPGATTTVAAPHGAAPAHVASTLGAAHRPADTEQPATHATNSAASDGIAAATATAETPPAHARGHEVAAAPPAAPVPPASSTHASATAAAAAAGTGGGHAQSIDDLMNRAVGSEHPAAEAAPAPAAALPATPSHAQVTSTLSPLASAVRACTQGATGTATVAMVIRNDGEVQTVSVSGPFEPTVNSCIQGVVRRAHFPAFTRPTMPLVYPFVVQPPH